MHTFDVFHRLPKPRCHRVLRTWLAVAAGSATLALFSGCASTSSRAVPAQPEITHDTLYQRAFDRFARVTLYKPAADGPGGITGQLAPLILQESASAEGVASTAPDHIGSIGTTQPGSKPGMDVPTVYATPQWIVINGEVRQQAFYVWFYPDRSRHHPSKPAGFQGFRVTVNAHGHPVIWEVLANDSPTRVFFVARSLEAAAAAYFGGPLPGRRHAVERDRENMPDVVVARIIEDGPVPMGPIVYLKAGSRAVTTIVCRCMASQGDVLSATHEYTLAHLTELPHGRLADSFAATHEQGDPVAEGMRMGNLLRLPPHF